MKKINSYKQINKLMIIKFMKQNKNLKKKKLILILKIDKFKEIYLINYILKKKNKLIQTIK
jgi:superoxide dismutase